MGSGNIFHYGFISSIHIDNRIPWYTTISENEVIEFKETNGQKREVNSLLIEAESTDLYIRILPFDYCLYVPANESRTYELAPIKSIQVMNPLGTKLRWSAMFY
jgi:hypothetical protein